MNWLGLNRKINRLVKSGPTQFYAVMQRKMYLNIFIEHLIDLLHSRIITFSIFISHLWISFEMHQKTKTRKMNGKSIIRLPSRDLISLASNSEQQQH